MKTILIIFSAFILTGCSAIRYNLGYRAGIKEYEKAKKTGYVKRSYGVGYINGFHLMKTMDDLEDASNKLTDAVKEWEKFSKEQNERMKKLKVTDEDIDALFEAEERKLLQKENMEKIERGAE